MRCDKATFELLLCTKNGTCAVHGTAGASATFLGSSTRPPCNFTGV